MMENHWNIIKICLFGQNTEQQLNNFELWKSLNTSNFEGWGLTLVACEKCIGDISKV